MRRHAVAFSEVFVRKYFCHSFSASEGVSKNTCAHFSRTFLYGGEKMSKVLAKNSRHSTCITLQLPSKLQCIFCQRCEQNNRANNTKKCKKPFLKSRAKSKYENQRNRYEEILEFLEKKCLF